MVLGLGLIGQAVKQIEKRKDKKKKNAFNAGVQAGMEKAGGGAGMSQLKEGGMVGKKKKAKAKKTGGAPHNRLY
jgi:hypothetical protein